LNATRDSTKEDLRESGIHDYIKNTANQTFSRDNSLRLRRTKDEMTTDILKNLNDTKLKNKVEMI